MMICKYALKIGKRKIGIDTSMTKTKALAKALIFFYSDYIGTVSSVLQDISLNKEDIDESDVFHLDEKRQQFAENVARDLSRDISFSVSNIDVYLKTKTGISFEVNAIDTESSLQYVKYRLNHVCDCDSDVHTTYELSIDRSKSGWAKCKVNLYFHFDI